MMRKVWREEKKPEEKKEREREIDASRNGPGAEGGNARRWVPFRQDWLLLVVVVIVVVVVVVVLDLG